MANPDAIHLDSNNKPVGAGLDPSTGKAANFRMTNVAVDSNGDYYGDLVVSQTGGGLADTIATGNLTAAQATAGTPVAGGTVSITLGEGQATVEAQLTGTFSNGTTVLFEGTDDTGTTTNWYTTFGQDTTVANPPNISSVAGPGPYLVRIPSAGYQQIRVRCTPYHAADNVAVRLIASVAGTSSASLSTNDGTFAKETGGVLGSTTDAAVVGDNNGSISAKARGLVKILNDIWDSTNHLIASNIKQIGGQSPTLDNTTILATSMRGKGAGTAGDTSLLLNSDGSLQADIRKVLGSAISYSNPLTNEPSTLQAIRNAKAFNATTGKIAETATKTIPFSIFNPNTAKNILILSLKVYMTGGSVVHEVRQSVTTDPGPAYTGASQITPVNLDAGGAASSASVYTTTTSTSPTGTAFDSAEVASNATFDFFGNGLGYLLPASSNNGLVVFVQTSTATESYAVVARWLEW